jgi:competence protein ComEC
LSNVLGGRDWKWSFFNPESIRKEWIYFNVLMPNLVSPQQEISSRNNNSCVLLIRWRDQVILLAGDIERSAERELLRFYKLPRVSVLVAPHHGSKTSSSQSFVDQLNPVHVVFSAGFQHRFGHPHPQVIQRYKNSGASLWSTAERGGVTFIWDHNAQLQVETAREIASPFWWR